MARGQSIEREIEIKQKNKKNEFPLSNEAHNDLGVGPTH